MTPTIHKYKEINVGKYKSVRHFELTEVIGQQVLSDLLNISQDREFAKSRPDYWVKTHNGKKWSNPITGLFKTKAEGNVYFGDLDRKKHLIIVSIGEGEYSEQMVVYVYQNWYPYHKNEHPKVTASKITEFKEIKNGTSGV